MWKITYARRMNRLVLAPSTASTQLYVSCRHVTANIILTSSAFVSKDFLIYSF